MLHRWDVSESPQPGLTFAEESFCDEASFAEDLLGGLRCGYLAIDRASRITQINIQACEILEVIESDVLGRPVDEALPQHPGFAKVLRDAFSLHCLPNRAEMDLRCRSDQKTIGFTLSLVEGVDGVPYGAAAFFKDLTRIEQREEQDRLRDRLAALGQMAASLAHEIRNPLASIEVSCSLLTRRMEPGSEPRQLLDKIISEVRRLNGTIHSSLEYVRPIELNAAPVAIQELLDIALQVATHRVSRLELTVVHEIEPDLGDMTVDRARIRQVFENLMINALEVMGERGRLTLRVHRTQDNTLLIEIEDSGPGIAADVKEKLFYPFFTTKATGSGIGLSVARKIVEAHRGVLDVENVPGGGARFTVRLPIDTTTQGFTS